MSRLSDKDRHYGPLTVGVSKPSALYPEFSLCFKAERDDYYIEATDSIVEKDVNRFYLFMGKYSFRLQVPTFIKTIVEQNSRHNYTEHYSRKYGVAYFDQGLCVYYGKQSNDQNKTWYWGIPWLYFRLIKREILNPDDSLYYTTDSHGSAYWNEYDDAKAGCGKILFVVKDYDDKTVEVTAHIERHVFRRGAGAFQWLGYVTPDAVYKRLELNFQSEVGRDKGSWKGGITEWSVLMRKGETPVDTMKRCCDTPINSKNGPSKLELISAVTLNHTKEST